MIDKLKAIHQSDKKPAQKVNKLLVLAPWFLHPHVGRFIRSNADTAEEVLCHAQDRGDLDEK